MPRRHTCLAVWSAALSAALLDFTSSYEGCCPSSFAPALSLSDAWLAFVQCLIKKERRRIMAEPRPGVSRSDARKIAMHPHIWQHTAAVAGRLAERSWKIVTMSRLTWPHLSGTGTLMRSIRKKSLHGVQPPPCHRGACVPPVWGFLWLGPLTRELCLLRSRFGVGRCAHTGRPVMGRPGPGTRR